MKLLLSVVLAIWLGCLALLTFLALLGVLALAVRFAELALSRRAWANLDGLWNTTAVKSVVKRSIIEASPCCLTDGPIA